MAFIHEIADVSIHHSHHRLSGNIRDRNIKLIHRHPSLIAKDTSLTPLQDPGAVLTKLGKIQKRFDAPRLSAEDGESFTHRERPVI